MQADLDFNPASALVQLCDVESYSASLSFGVLP